MSKFTKGKWEVEIIYGYHCAVFASNLNCVRDEDFEKLKELSEILKQGYIQAEKMIQEESSNGKMVGNKNVDAGNAGD